MPEFAPAALAAIAAAYAAAGLLKGALGLGFTTSCLPLLVLMLGHHESLPLVIIPSIASNLIVMRATPGFVAAARAFWPMYVAALPGIAIGLMVLGSTDDRVTTAILGVVMVAYVGFTILTPARVIGEARLRRWLVPVGVVNGALNGITGSQMIPMVPVLMSADLAPDRFIHAVNAVFTLSSLAMFLGLSQAGLLSITDVAVSTLGIAVVYGGVALGTRLRAVLSTESYRRGVLMFLGVLGLAMILRAMTE